ncbi:hypothetical protein CLV97_110113 [Planifilum fimeticola]|uniref:Uncharacterized protein n=2 Tax=Planifilum fimeticola TaxID=201975 RepID=A0A2T0LFE3_9BACL|nr:hypothetical protein CLV97_110113 [Planifilum fimeticola]
MEKSPSMLEEVENAIPSTTSTMETGVEGEVKERVEVETPPTSIVEKKEETSTPRVEGVEDVEEETSRRKVERVEKAGKKNVEVPPSTSAEERREGDRENCSSCKVEEKITPASTFNGEREKETIPGSPLEVAMKIMKEEGKVPGRKRLMEEGFSEWVARQTAKELKRLAG